MSEKDEPSDDMPLKSSSGSTKENDMPKNPKGGWFVSKTKIALFAVLIVILVIVIIVLAVLFGIVKARLREGI
jgi:hypothetical protein